LEKITDENDYPDKIKSMVEDLRYAKERVRTLEGKLRIEEKSGVSQHEQIVNFE